MEKDQLTDLTRRLIIQEVQKLHPDLLIPVALSARHIHLRKEDFHRLFGPESNLHQLHSLSQPKEFMCSETVDLVGSKRTIHGVRIVGPLRKQTQIEISLSDGHVLGINPPIRQSGDLEGSPGVYIMGPKGAILLEKGLICAARHIHMSPEDAQRFGVVDKQIVAISFPGKRAGVLDEIMVRVNPDYALEFHIDVDEGNALFLKTGDVGHLLSAFNHQIYSPFR